MALKFEELTDERKNKLFDTVQALLKEFVWYNEIKLKAMTIHGIADSESLDDFIIGVKDWCETRALIDRLN